MVKIIISKSYFDEYKYGINIIKGFDIIKQPSIVLVPQHITLQAENELILSLKSKGLFNVDVMNIRRFISKFGNSTNQIDEIGKILILLNIIDKNAKKLKLYGKSSKNIDFVENLSMLLNEFRNSLIEPREIEMIAQRMDDDFQLLKYKLEEINLIYSNYIDILKSGIYDERKLIDELVVRVNEQKILKNTNLFVDGFSDMSLSQIEMLAKISKNVNYMQIRLVSSNFEHTPIHSHIEKFKEKLIKIFNSNEVDIEILELKNEPNDFCNDFSEIFSCRRNADFSKIQLVCASSPEEEIKTAVFDIFQQCRMENTNLGEFAILTQDISKFDYIIEDVCKNFEIPYFLSEKRPIINHHYADFILGIFDVILSRYSSNAVLNFLKNKFVGMGYKAIYKLKVLSSEKDIRFSSRWKKLIQDIIKYNALTDKELEDNRYEMQEEDIRILSDSILGIIDLEKGLSGAKSNSECINILLDFIRKFSIEQKLFELSQHVSLSGDVCYSQELSQIYDVVNSVFEQISKISDLQPNIKDIYNFLYYAFHKIKIGVLPQDNEYLFFGSFKSSKLGRLKKIYLFDMSEGVVPSRFEETGIFSFSEREFLKQKKLIDVKNFSYEYDLEAYNIYENMLGVEKGVVWSYSKFSEGKENFPSLWYSSLNSNRNSEFKQITRKDIRNTGLKIFYFDTLLQSFVNREELEEVEYEHLHNFIEEGVFEFRLQKALQGFTYENIANIDSDLLSAAQMYGKNLNVSISRLEKFVKCPYQHFVDYILKPQVIDPCHFNSFDIGNIFHYIFEKIMNEISKCEFESLSEDEIKSLFRKKRNLFEPSDIDEMNSDLDILASTHLWNELFERYYEEILNHNPKFKLNAKNVYYANRFKQIVKSALKYNIIQLRLTKFKNLYNEISNFDRNTNTVVGSLKIVDDGNKKVYIIGKIDRVDIAKLDEKGLGNYIRIIDYKTGHTEFNHSLFEVGLSLQLPIYLNMILHGQKNKLHDIKPYGAFYFVVPSDLFFGRESSIFEILSQCILNGIVLNEEEVHNAVDMSIRENNEKSLVDSFIKNPKKNSKESKYMYDFDQMSRMLDMSLEKAREISNSIYDMDISVSPVGNRLDYIPCDSCKYKDICKFDEKDQRQKYRFL